jgi:hypothetical protein
MDYYHAFRRNTAQLQFAAAKKVVEALALNHTYWYGGFIGMAFGTTLNITTYVMLWRQMSWYEFGCFIPFISVWILFICSLMTMLMILTGEMTRSQRLNFVDKMKRNLDIFLSEIPETPVSKMEELKNCGKDSDDEDGEETCEELEELIKNIKEEVICKPKSEKLKADTVDYCGEPFPEKNDSSDSDL